MKNIVKPTISDGLQAQPETVFLLGLGKLAVRPKLYPKDQQRSLRPQIVAALQETEIRIGKHVSVFGGICLVLLFGLLISGETLRRTWVISW